MRRLARATCFFICLVSFIIAVPVVLSGNLRSAYVIAIYTKLGKIWPHEYAIVGDSLARDCSWPFNLGKPLSTAVLVQGGSGLRDAARQVVSSRAMGAQYLFISTGLNDIILRHDPVDQIAYNVDFLFQQIQAGQKALVSLIPYVADGAFAPAIDAANTIIADKAKQRGFAILDLNKVLGSTAGVRRPAMTADGVHLSGLACDAWIAAVKTELARLP